MALTEAEIGDIVADITNLLDALRDSGLFPAQAQELAVAAMPRIVKVNTGSQRHG